MLQRPRRCQNDFIFQCGGSIYLDLGFLLENSGWGTRAVAGPGGLDLTCLYDTNNIYYVMFVCGHSISFVSESVIIWYFAILFSLLAFNLISLFSPSFTETNVFQQISSHRSYVTLSPTRGESDFVCGLPAASADKNLE